VDASLVVADANTQRSIPGSEWSKGLDAQAARRAAKDYLATLDAEAFGAASSVTPKFVSPSDPAAQWTGAMHRMTGPFVTMTTMTDHLSGPQDSADCRVPMRMASRCEDEHYGRIHDKRCTRTIQE
jgi:hypothetical protein